MACHLSAVKKGSLPVIIFITFAWVGFSYADESHVNINANIVAATCKIAATSVNQTVDLGKGRIADLTEKNAATQWQDFSVELTDCPASVTEVTATISGTPDTLAAEYYRNTGSAGGVAIDVMDILGNEHLSNGKTLTTPVDTNQNALLKMKGRMISPEGHTTSGSVAAAIELNFDFH